jgi:hypothetical protein
MSGVDAVNAAGIAEEYARALGYRRIAKRPNLLG